jgi:hypothetical protein|tara:strand:- start:1363 stop:1587 length:225 start_codon:yes stop_codon:yes gene_type:complete
MLQVILNWFLNTPTDTVVQIEPTFTSIVHTEDSLSELTKDQLKDLGENEFDLTFKSNDRKAAMIKRILTSQSEK